MATGKKNVLLSLSLLDDDDKALFDELNKFLKFSKEPVGTQKKKRRPRTPSTPSMIPKNRKRKRNELYPPRKRKKLNQSYKVKI